MYKGARMKKYKLLVGVNIRHSDFTLDYEKIGSLIDFSEIEDKETRENLIDFFLKNNYIAEVETDSDDKTKKESNEQDKKESEEVGENVENDMDDFEEVSDDSEDVAEEADVPVKKPAKRTSRKR